MAKPTVKKFKKKEYIRLDTDYIDDKEQGAAIILCIDYDNQILSIKNLSYERPDLNAIRGHMYLEAISRLMAKAAKIGKKKLAKHCVDNPF